MNTRLQDVWMAALKNNISIRFEGQGMYVCKDEDVGKGAVVIAHMTKVEECGFHETIREIMEKINAEDEIGEG